MINYSIVKRSVNANFLAINQAKSRINQSKKEGKEPEKADLDLMKTEKQNAFAVSQHTDIMTIEKFAKHITFHGSVYSRADKFTSQNITNVKVQWEPGQEFKNLRDDAEFNLVASRSAQAAVLKAIKEGKTSDDLNAPTTPVRAKTSYV